MGADGNPAEWGRHVWHLQQENDIHEPHMRLSTLHSSVTTAIIPPGLGGGGQVNAKDRTARREAHRLGLL